VNELPPNEVTLMTTVTLELECDPITKRWKGTCAALPGFATQGLTLRKARHRLLRELHKAHADLTYVEVIKLPEPEASAYQTFQRDRETHARLEHDLPEQRLELAQRLIRLQMSVADAARLLQLSPQRLALHLHADVVMAQSAE